MIMETFKQICWSKWRRSFEDQQGDYVELDDLMNFDLKICTFGTADLVGKFCRLIY